MFCKVGSEKADSGRIIIYGAGNDGICIFMMLLDAGIYVSAFCDADRQKQEVRIMNKKVIAPEELYADKDKEHIRIFIGSRKYKEEIKTALQEAGFSQIYENKGLYQDKISCGKEYRYGRKSWYSIIEQTYHKRIYIYGTSTLELEFARKLQLTDIEISGFLTNEKDGKAEAEIPEFLISEWPLYDKEHTMVYVLSEIPQRVKMLEAMGLRNGYHYRVGPYIYGGWRLQNPYVRLDVNCGFTYVDHEETPGYTVTGDTKSSSRIMILGASGTDPYYGYYRKWVYFLQDYLEKESIKATIYNGALQAYSEQQSLLKLIRELPVIAPDLVIHYGGGLEMLNLLQKERLFSNERPFASKYTADLLRGIKPMQREYINRQLISALFTAEEKQEVCLGLSHKKTGEAALLAAKNYVYAVNCMRAVCNMQGIAFLNFLDPVLACTEKIGRKDREKLYHDEEFQTISESKSCMRVFRQTVSEKLDAGFHTDLTQILAGDEMYEDIWHPNEKGNQILAKHVFDKVLASVDLKKKDGFGKGERDE